MNDLEDAARSAQSALGAVVALMELARRELEQGASPDAVQQTLCAHQAPQARSDAEQAIRRYQHAVMTFRAQSVRTMVDDEGMTITAVSRQLGLSRQLTARMYGQVRATRDS